MHVLRREMSANVVCHVNASFRYEHDNVDCKLTSNLCSTGVRGINDEMRNRQKLTDFYCYSL